MSVTTRDVIKACFETGDVPTQDQFADLIDSLLCLKGATDGIGNAAGLTSDTIVLVVGGDGDLYKTTVGSLLTIPRNVTIITASAHTTLALEVAILANTVSNHINITLSNMVAGQIINIKKISSSNTLTISPSTGLVDGLASISTVTNNYNYSILFDGTNYWLQ